MQFAYTYYYRGEPELICVFYPPSEVRQLGSQPQELQMYIDINFSNGVFGYTKPSEELI